MTVRDILTEHKQGYYKPGKFDFGDVHFVRISDLTDDAFLNEKTTPMIYIEPEVIKSFSIKKNDFLFARTGGAGRFGLIHEDIHGIFASYLIRFRFKDNYDSHFLRYFFLTDSFQYELKSKIHGGVNQNVHAENIKDCFIPKMTLPEQHRIVSILDKAFAAIATAKANAEQNLKNAKELLASYLQSVFENKSEGWEEKPLGEVCEFMQGIQRDVKLQSEIQKENQVRFLRIIDFTQGGELPRYIDNPGEKYILNQSDVSLVRYGASTGFVCRGLEGALANNLFRVIPKSNKIITNDFLFVFLTSPVFQNVIKLSMNGAAMPAISFGLIYDIPFPIIPLKDQQSIVQKLDALSAETKKLEAIYQQKVVDLEELKKSVLQKAFNGEL